MAKYDFLNEQVNRVRRRVGRIINGKTLPPYVYRFDTRAPAVIRVSGFQPWDALGAVSLMEHVNNAFAANHAKAGMQTKYDSQWVSTGGYGLIAKIDPTFAQQILNTNLYKIDTSIALRTGNFSDANDHFDRAGINRPYATQREWIKSGGIPQEAVIECMEGLTYANQLDNRGNAPAENLLQGWRRF
ncbi:hypothetical protein [Microbulbifer spongiae]|uniref:Uncharacterized protein n=1 Tax=Microbulbifer spongiae TaxID=2944933 RepID=A0ABY9ECN6_9GAMM|nr:hypothetical protein [Microbulbifer sp. MI-G]WKD50042.1 hypothetical protein M8T91_01035 [Microbulbifer sp. MI-G]